MERQREFVVVMDFELLGELWLTMKRNKITTMETRHQPQFDCGACATWSCVTFYSFGRPSS